MDPRRLLPVLAALACACVVAVVVVRLGGPHGEPRATPSAPAGPPGPAAVLAGWDDRRASAWAAGDPAALAGLYVRGSRAGAADVRLLRDYVDRGLVVAGLTTQVLGLEVDRQAPQRLVLVVTDRVVGGEVVSGDGSRWALPVDRASTRRVELVRRDGRWVVADARDQEPGQARAAARTSRTSSSSKS